MQREEAVKERCQEEEGGSSERTLQPAVGNPEASLEHRSFGLLNVVMTSEYAINNEGKTPSC